VCNEGDKPLSKDEALEKAIEAGAEEVIEGYDDDDRLALKVTDVMFCFCRMLLFSFLLFVIVTC